MSIIHNREREFIMRMPSLASMRSSLPKEAQTFCDRVADTLLNLKGECQDYVGGSIDHSHILLTLLQDPTIRAFVGAPQETQNLSDSLKHAQSMRPTALSTQNSGTFLNLPMEEAAWHLMQKQQGKPFHIVSLFRDTCETSPGYVRSRIKMYGMDQKIERAFQLMDDFNAAKDTAGPKTELDIAREQVRKLTDSEAGVIAIREEVAANPQRYGLGPLPAQLPQLRK